MGSSLVAAGLGELLWDELPGGRVLGGAPANFAWHAAQLGAEAHVVSAVGRDADGDGLLDALRARGIGVGGIGRADGLPSGRVTVTVDAGGSPRYVIHQPSAWDGLTASASALELAARADVVSFGSLAQRAPAARAGLRTLVAATPGNALRVFDVNLRQAYYDADAVAWGLGVAGGFKLNDEELPVVAGLAGLPAGEDAFASALLARHAGLDWIALTRGAAGATLWTAARAGRPAARYDAPAPKVVVVDTVGAGDALTATLAVGWRRGAEPRGLLAVSVKAAAMVCGRAGATPVWPEGLRAEALAAKARR